MEILIMTLGPLYGIGFIVCGYLLRNIAKDIEYINNRIDMYETMDKMYKSALLGAAMEQNKKVNEMNSEIIHIMEDIETLRDQIRSKKKPMIVYE
jgi:hypothetical protein